MGNGRITLAQTTRRFIVLLVVLALFCTLFSQVIFQQRNFAYRDAGHFYYPLLRLVRDEWNAGRWPLWNPYENSGMPLLGNPASAVFYPPRILLFQWLPLSYATAYKWYILSHVLLSAAAAYLLARHSKASEYAAGLAALSYAFGAVVMFQYCNVIFLVGAAWVPLGLVAADRALRLGQQWWGVGFGVVLALQVLGGDPEAAYLTGGLAAIYAALLDPVWAVGLGAFLALLMALEGREEAIHLVGLTVWAAPYLIRRGQTGRAALALRRRRTLALGTAALVAAGLSAVQWIPSWEFGRLSVRAAPESSHNPYTFWVEPWRYLELWWPNFSGRQFPENSRWIEILPVSSRIWEPSLYMGALPCLLAVSSWKLRDTTPWRRLLSLTLVLSLWAALGPAGGAASWYRGFSPQVGDRSATEVEGGSAISPERLTTRPDAQLTDPAGGLYWFLVEVLPGFRRFRFPAKLLVFAAAAAAALAAVGWDRLTLQKDPRTQRLLGLAAAISIALALIALLGKAQLIRRFEQSPLATFAPYFGPLDCSRAFWYLLLAFAQCGLLLGIVFALKKWWFGGGSISPAASVGILALAAIDLAVANHWMVATAPQSLFDSTPKLVNILQQAEENSSDRSSDSGYLRAHRASIWWPQKWGGNSSPRRNEQVMRWEKDTIQPKYGLPHGISYTISEGTTEAYDYWFFFAPFLRTLRPEVKRELEQRAGQIPDRVVYYPRRGYDLWGTRYFVLPNLISPAAEHRGILSFLPDTALLAESALDEDDYQVLRNLNCYPRAWIVHRLLVDKPIRGLRRSDRFEPMERILYQGDALWFDRELEPTKLDLRRVAWIEAEPELRDALFPGWRVTVDPQKRIEQYQAPGTAAEDHCHILSYGPHRVEIVAETSAPGVVILSDAFLPGWQVTVDGRAQPILRANRMMRGVTLEPGRHKVIFEYNPLSFRLGVAVSLTALLALGLASGSTLALTYLGNIR